MDDRTRLDKALAGAEAFLKTVRAAETPPIVDGGGAHAHELTEGRGATDLDGFHAHSFVVPERLLLRAESGAEIELAAGAVLSTTVGGPHSHELSDGQAAPTGTAHRHVIVLAEDEIEFFTETDGDHAHAIAGGRAEPSGAHAHELRFGDLALTSRGPDGAGPLSKARMVTEAELRSLAVGELPEGTPPVIVGRRPSGAGRTTFVIDTPDDVLKLAPFDALRFSISERTPIEIFTVPLIEGRRSGTLPAVVWMAEPPRGVLPALKVPDPGFLVGRLRDGKTAGLLSRRRRALRVGRPQALVNEVAPTGLGKSFVWAVVSQADPTPIESMAELSAEQRAGLDEWTAREFSTERGLYFLPLELVVLFDPPLELKTPPRGRRFGSTVDFDRDVVKVSQVTIEEALRCVARKDVLGFVSDPSLETLRRATDAELAQIDLGLHELFERAFAGSDVTRAEGVTREDVINAHVFVLNELERRRVETVETDALAEETAAFVRGAPAAGVEKRLPGGGGKFAVVNPGGAREHEGDFIELGDVLSQLEKPMALRMPAVYIVGSIANHGRTENDVDVLIRGPLDEETRNVVAFRIGRALEPRISGRVQFHFEDQGGPYTNHVALFDLVLVPHEDRAVKEMAAIAKQDDPALDWPDKPGPRPAVFQFHFRGSTLHGDLRFRVNDHLVGWTIAIQKPGAVPEVDTVAEGRRIAAAFDVDGSEFTKPMVLPARLFAAPKSRQPVEWLSIGDVVVEPGGVGATRNEPGVYVEVSDTRVEWGLQKPHAHEYFLTGDPKFYGRMAFRLLAGDAGAPENRVGDGELFWTCGFTQVALPGVLATRAVETRSMPPLGQSAMPASLMRATPREFRFWLADSEREAREVRDALVAERFFTEQNVTVEGAEFRRVDRKIMVAPFDPDEEEDGAAELADEAKAVPTVPFSLAWQWFKGQTVVRAAPSRQLWHLVIAGRDGATDWQLQRDPLSGEDAISALQVDAGRELLDFEGDVPPGTEIGGVPLNETKATPSSVALQDRGKVELLEDGAAFKKLRFHGRKLRGVFTIVAEEAGGKLWQFSPGETPSRAIPKLAARGDGHVHELPDGTGETAPAAGRDHVHELPDGATTGTPVQNEPGRDVRHRHMAAGELTGPERTFVAAEKRFRTGTDGTQIWDLTARETSDDSAGDREKLRPPAVFQPMKPANRETNEFTDPDEAARRAFTDQLVRAGVEVEPKLNGFRAVAERWSAREGVRDPGVLVFTEDNRRDLAPSLRGLATELEAIGGDFVLDGEIMAVDDSGAFVPRRDLARFRTGSAVDDSALRFVAFDALYLPEQGNVTARPQADRRRALERWWRSENVGRGRHLVLAERRVARTRSALRRALTWAGSQDGSEGGMLKQVGASYSLGGENDLWAKVKIVREIRALVVARHEVQGSPGVYNFTGAVGPIPAAEADEWRELVEHGGQKFAIIGRTGNRKLDANVGDVIVVETLELLWEEGPPRRIRWFGPAQAVDVVAGRPTTIPDLRAMLRTGETKTREATLKSTTATDRPVRILKADTPEERYILGVILVPDEPDAQGDIYDSDEVRKAAHSFMEFYGGETFKIMHNGQPVDGVKVLETYVSKAEETHGGETFPVGTWLLAVRVVNDDLWAAVRRGAFTGFSMGGTALRESLSTSFGSDV